ncbi:MAG TPA: hypothetical protein VLT92_03010, partial [Burkholderiales bacterium]|nr:hypothetical protein [Burkholderiales bacterium]
MFPELKTADEHQKNHFPQRAQSSQRTNPHEPVSVIVHLFSVASCTRQAGIEKNPPWLALDLLRDGLLLLLFEAGIVMAAR